MNKKIAAAVATIGLICITGLGATSASAAESATTEEQSGVAYDVPNGDFTASSTASETSGVTPLTTVNVGGGTWNYGSSSAGWNQKRCYSHYIHKTKRHSASVVIGSQEQTVYANAGQWARAERTGGWFDTCNTYWWTA